MEKNLNLKMNCKFEIIWKMNLNLKMNCKFKIIWKMNLKNEFMKVIH